MPATVSLYNCPLELYGMTLHRSPVMDVSLCFCYGCLHHSPGAVPSFLSQVNLNTIKRCLLINYNPDSQELDFRH